MKKWFFALALTVLASRAARADDSATGDSPAPADVASAANVETASPAPPAAVESIRSTPVASLSRKGRLTFNASGEAVLTRDGLSTQLDPSAFYQLVGRDDLSSAYKGRFHRQVAVVASGWIIGIAGELVLDVGLIREISITGSKSPGLIVAGLGGLGVGAGLLLFGALGLGPDTGGISERRSLADSYNAGSAQSQKPSGESSATAVTTNELAPALAELRHPLETVRVGPLLGYGTRGLAVGLLF